ncbi:MAG TPA: NAD(P)-binding domain-containing protein [Gemmatimonadales bacterium]|nr:NAD(P)-binding domain-containing protein [Gemmatimonadales bacterium]
MNIGILGSGLMGGKLGTLFARAGHDVVFSYARSQEKLKGLARDAGGKARPGTPREAAQEADVLLLAVHWSRIDDVLKQAGHLVGKIILSCSLPMNADDTELVVAHTSSGAEELARRTAGARVVAAFNTVPSEVLFGVYEARGGATRPSLVYCGDDTKGKEIAGRLIRDVGFDPIDAGTLRIARYMEPFGLLVAQLAYECDGGPELGYRFERFAG